MNVVKTEETLGRAEGRVELPVTQDLLPLGALVTILTLALASSGCSGKKTRPMPADGAMGGQTQPQTSSTAPVADAGSLLGGSEQPGSSDGSTPSGGIAAAGGVSSTTTTEVMGTGGMTGSAGKTSSGGAGDSVRTTTSGGKTASGGLASGGTAGLGGKTSSGGTGGTGEKASSASGGTGGSSSRQTCEEGATLCLSNFYLQICKGGTWAAHETCGMHQVCSTVDGVDKCACLAEPACTAEGTSCSGASTMVTCSRDTRSCLYKTTTTCDEKSCSGPDGSASCCAKTCTVGSAGCATSTSIGSCALAANGCSAFTVPTTCADRLVCGHHAAPECFDSDWASWPMPNNAVDVSEGAPNPMSFKDNGDGTVTDSVTSLMWEKDEVQKGLTWSEAVARCSSLALAGHRDWGLPSLIELLSIADHSKPVAIDKTYFPAALPGPYWTSTIASEAPDRALVVDFRAGVNGFQDKSAVANARCVRR